MLAEICFGLLTLVFTIYGLYEAIIFLKYVVYQRILLRIFKKPVDLKNSGQWAVITGCTDGIGRAFAYKFAKIGMDVVLVSRSRSKLNDLSSKLREEYGVKTKIIVADFTNTDRVIPEIQEELNDLDVGVLVNNVGVSTGIAPFLDCDKSEIMDLIEINVRGTMRMCSVVLPNMVKKRKGVIINMSSLSAVLPCNQICCYGASKAFIAKFSKELNKEYKDFGITIHCLTSGFVQTKMTNLPRIPWLIPSPEIYARSALKTVGLSDVTTGYSYHDVFEYSIKFVSGISETLCSYMNDAILRFASKVIDVPSTATRENTSII